MERVLPSKGKGGVMARQKREEIFTRDKSADRLDYPSYHFVSRPYVKL